MPLFLYIGAYERYYPEINTGNGSLLVEPGDTHEFEEAPQDGQWVAVPPSPAPKPVTPAPVPPAPANETPASVKED